MMQEHYTSKLYDTGKKHRMKRDSLANLSSTGIVGVIKVGAGKRWSERWEGVERE